MASRTAAVRLDAVSANAVDLARAALLEVTEPGQVGDHLRVEATADRVVSHIFACTMPGYRGWSWVVVLSRAPRAKAPTVTETALLPGEEALLAPRWVPWPERLRPEDVGADDNMPYEQADPRLEPGYEQTDDAEADHLAIWELGLGRERVLSPLGREEAATRWEDGEFGPRELSARGRRGAVEGQCSTCGFLTQLSGSLRQEFGVCANEWSSADGHVVSLAYGCGSHSETGKEEGHLSDPTGQVVLDEINVEFEQLPEADAATAGAGSEADAPTADAAPVGATSA